MIDRKHPEYQYLNLAQDILDHGSDKELFFAPEIKKQYEEKGEQPPFIRSVFGRQIRFDLSQGFPLLTTKKVFLKGIIYELLWFLQGDSNVKYLIDHNVNIWDDWAYKNYLKDVEIGIKPKITIEEFAEQVKKEDVDSEFVQKYCELGPIYGRQWRKWRAEGGREIDQIAWLIEKIKKTPSRKSMIVCAWNPEYIYEMALPGQSMALPPCHTIWQPNISDGKLSLQLYQRSADLFLGVPFNIASYSLLTILLAHVTGYQPGDFVHTFGDVHIYSNHFDQMKEQISREPRPFPTLKINPEVTNIDDFKYDDFTLENYNPHPTLKGEIAVIGGF